MKKIHLVSVVGILLVSLISGLIYITVQQSLRLSANDPQIQMSEDSAKLLVNGKMPQQLLVNPIVDLAQSLDPFIIIYSQDGKPVVSSGILNNQIPLPPNGVFSYTKSHTQDRFTWQPQQGVRIAAVITYYPGLHPGFVLAGRSLREVEKREDLLTQQVAVFWLVLVAIVVGAHFYLGKSKRSLS